MACLKTFHVGYIGFNILIFTFLVVHCASLPNPVFRSVAEIAKRLIFAEYPQLSVYNARTQVREFLKKHGSPSWEQLSGAMPFSAACDGCQVGTRIKRC